MAAIIFCSLCNIKHNKSLQMSLDWFTNEPGVYRLLSTHPATFCSPYLREVGMGLQEKNIIASNECMLVQHKNGWEIEGMQRLLH